MTKNRKNPGPKVAEAAADRKSAAINLASIAVQREKAALEARGSNKPITPAMIAEALEMLSCGYPMDVVTEHLGVNRSALLQRAGKDPDFATTLREAWSMGTVSIVNDTLRVARGEEGYSTGSIERDKLVCDQAWKYAKTIGNRIFGDKLQVETTQIMYALPAPEFDATVVEVTVEAEADPDPED